MKYSNYNFVFRNGTSAVIYNEVSDGTILLQPELVQVIQETKDNIDSLQSRHQELYDAMVGKGMIVDGDMDEAEHIVENWRLQDNNPEHYFLTILPTLNCNLRCWYCYEEHKATANMTEETLGRVCRLIDNLTGNGKLKYLHLSFFGGEPLLPFKKTVWPLLQYTGKLCQEREVRLLVHFTTNGVLLTPKVIDCLMSLPLAEKPGVQITLDGNREYHNNSRHTVNKGPTFDIIVNNIHAALKAGMYVTNRFNYTQKSVDSIVDVLEAYKDLTPEEREKLQFDFQQVWQEEHLEDVRLKALKLAKTYSSNDFRVFVEKRYNSQRCGSDADNQVAVNYDGRLYSCTARDTNDEECEGYLSEDGTLVWNGRHKKRMAIKYGNTTCRKCRIFPICHGGCSQLKLEAGDEDRCIRGYDKNRQLEIVQGRLDFILRNSRPITNSPKQEMPME